MGYLPGFPQMVGWAGGPAFELAETIQLWVPCPSRKLRRAGTTNLSVGRVSSVEGVPDLYCRGLLSSKPVPPTLAKGAQGWGTHIVITGQKKPGVKGRATRRFQKRQT